MKMKNTKAILVAVIGATVAGVVSFNAFARPAYGYETTYYADAARTEMVGSRELTCNGRSFSTGITSPYFDTISYKC